MPENELAGATALVTGASQGFGSGIAAALSGAGAQVIGVARDRGALDELREALGESFTAVPADAADPMVAGQLIDAHRPAVAGRPVRTKLTAGIGAEGIAEVTACSLAPWDASRFPPAARAGPKASRWPAIQERRPLTVSPRKPGSAGDFAGKPAWSYARAPWTVVWRSAPCGHPRDFPGVPARTGVALVVTARPAAIPGSGWSV